MISSAGAITVTMWGSQSCHGVYGPVGITTNNGAITVGLFNSPAQVIIYNYLDIDHLKVNGQWVRCDDDKISKNECSKDSKGQVILSMVDLVAPVGNYILNSSMKDPIGYTVQLTGMYCVEIVSETNNNQQMIIDYKNSYGNLPGPLYATIPFYTTMTVVYALICLAWFYGSYIYSKELLSIQKFISYVLVFLVIEYFVNLQLYEAYNRDGEVSNAFLYFTAILSAGRNSLSWFMLLIVSLGYGVWRPSLGKAMYFCVALGVVNFIAGCAYSIYGLLGSDLDELQALIITLPLSLSVTLFYSFSLNALQVTTNTLAIAKQNVKLDMYKSILRILGLSVVMAVGVIVLNIVYLSRRFDPDVYPYLWKYKWLMIDGVFHLIYFGVFCGIASLFRPTSNNQRYGMSEMLQEDLDDGELYGLEVVHGLDGSDDEEDVMKWVQENVMPDEKEEQREEDKADANEFEVRRLV
jgi:hypothetical protein